MKRAQTVLGPVTEEKVPGVERREAATDTLHHNPIRIDTSYSSCSPFPRICNGDAKVASPVCVFSLPRTSFFQLVLPTQWMDISWSWL